MYSCLTRVKKCPPETFILKPCETLLFYLSCASSCFVNTRLKSPLLGQTCEMSTVKLLGVWINRHLSSRCFTGCVLGNTWINDYDAPPCLLRPGRHYGTVPEKEAGGHPGRKRGLRAADIAEKLRKSEKEKDADTTNKVR